MKIAAHIFGEAGKSKLLAAIRYNAAQFPHHNFLVFTHQTIADLPANCGQIMLAKTFTKMLGLSFWYSYQLSKLLKAHRANVFVSNAGLLPKKGTVSSYLFIEKEDVIKKALSNLAFSKKVFVTDGHLETLISEKCKAQNIPLTKLLFDVDGNRQQSDWEAQEATKEKFTNGADYFLVHGSAENVSQLPLILKAFSQLKKWQKTSMKLLIVVRGTATENIIPDFKNYKYRSEVLILPYAAEDDETITAAAFAIIYADGYLQKAVVEIAMLQQIPVIALEQQATRSLFSEAVLFADAEVDALSQKMQLLYKDEALKKELLAKATVFLQMHNTADASQLFLNNILE